jgi:glycosyltransferase involved in cell wall biosynthesis
MRQRILVQLPSYDAGGAENYALRLIRHGGSDDYDWHVTTRNLRHATLEIAFRRAGAQVHHAGPGYGQPRHVLSFHRFLRHYRFDAVMTLTGVFGGLGLSIARLAGVPRRIAWHRRSTPAYALTRGRRLYARQSLALLHWGSTRILSNSRAALDNLHGRDWAQSTKFGVIPNGVDATLFRPRPELGLKLRAELGIAEAAKVIGHVGRVDPAKDHDTLIAVAAKLRPKYDSLRLLIAGTGTDSPEFAKRLERAGIRDIAVPLGVRSDVETVYQAMNVFVFPSVTEGQPNALIEAMLCGVPVIASDIPPVREAVPPYLQSRLFTCGDVTRAVQMICSLLEQHGDEEARARAWAIEHFDPVRNFGAVMGVVSA